MNENLGYGVLLVLALIGVTWGLISRPWHRKINKWAEERGFKLIKFKGAKFYEGPSAWLRDSDFREEFHITVEDQQGRIRNGWIVFESSWGLGPYKYTKVIWDD